MLQARKSRGERLLGRVRLLGEIRSLPFWGHVHHIRTRPVICVENCVNLSGT